MQIYFFLPFRYAPNIPQGEAAPNSQGGTRPDERSGLSGRHTPKQPDGQELQDMSVDSHLVSIMCNFLLFI